MLFEVDSRFRVFGFFNTFVAYVLGSTIVEWCLLWGRGLTELSGAR